MGNNYNTPTPILIPSLTNSQTPSLTINNIRPYLYFKTYGEYADSLNEFAYLFAGLIEDIKYPSNKTILENQVMNNPIVFKSTLSTEELFDVAMAIYHRIVCVYGKSVFYNQRELSRITFSLISKYVAVQNPLQENLLSSIADIIIKRTNFFSDDLPFRLRTIIELIQEKCIYIYRHDKMRNLNFYIEPFVVGFNKTFSYMDYIVYIFFMIENIIPDLRGKFSFGERINLIFNFNNDEANIEMITYILHWVNLYYPLVINKCYIVNYNEESITKSFAFKKDLDANDHYKRVIMCSSKFKDVLLTVIDDINLPCEYGGKGRLKEMVYNQEIDSHENLGLIILRMIFNDKIYNEVEDMVKNSQDNMYITIRNELKEIALLKENAKNKRNAPKSFCNGEDDEEDEFIPDEKTKMRVRVRVRTMK